MAEFRTIDFDYNEIDIDRDGNNDHVTFRVRQTGEEAVSIQTFIDMSGDGFGNIDSQDTKRFTLTEQPGWRLSEVKYEAQKLVLLGEDGTETSLPINEVIIPRSVASAGLLDVDLGAVGSDELSRDIMGGVERIHRYVKGVQFGEGGLGQRGCGLGGGGSAAGLGGLGTKGRGSGGSGYGTGGGHFGSRGEGKIATVSNEAVVIGGADKPLIDAVIRRNLNQIRYCYQRALSHNPSLSGKITVKFVIEADGTVSSATTVRTTMHNPEVEQAINSRFMRFQFPAPTDGERVTVTYPFSLTPDTSV